VNNYLRRAKFEESRVSIWRAFCLNTTVGVVGLFDVAPEWGLQRKWAEEGAMRLWPRHWVWGVFQRALCMCCRLLGLVPSVDGSSAYSQRRSAN